MRPMTVRHVQKGLVGQAVTDHYVPQVAPDGQSIIHNYMVGVVWAEGQTPAISYHPVGELEFVEFTAQEVEPISYDEDEEEEEDEEEDSEEYAVDGDVAG